MAKELRSVLDKGRDPARENRGGEVPPVEDLIQYIAENLVTKTIGTRSRPNARPPNCLPRMGAADCGQRGEAAGFAVPQITFRAISNDS